MYTNGRRNRGGTSLTHADVEILKQTGAEYLEVPMNRINCVYHRVDAKRRPDNISWARTVGCISHRSFEIAQGRFIHLCLYFIING